MLALPFIWQDFVILSSPSALGSEETIFLISKAKISSGRHPPWASVLHVSTVISDPFVSRGIVTIVFLPINIVKSPIPASPSHIPLSQMIILGIILWTVVIALSANLVASIVNIATSKKEDND
jgi:hypothetical protein